MYLQENTVFDLDPNLDLGVKVIPDVAQYALHHMIFAPAKFEVTVQLYRSCINKKKQYST